MPEVPAELAEQLEHLERSLALNLREQERATDELYDLKRAEATMRASIVATRERLRATTLTPREAQVLALIVEGKKGVEIAEALGISPHSVKSYSTQINRKLGVSNRAEAVAVAFRRGLAR